jgi:hypothetical protein
MRWLIQLLTSNGMRLPPFARWIVLVLVSLACILQLTKNEEHRTYVSESGSGNADDPVPPARLTISQDGRALVITGLIGNGTKAQLTRLLDENPSVNTIALRSAGGRAGESLSIAKEVAQRHLSTYVATECSSTCTAILISGSPRTASPRAKIGFHGTRTGLTRTSARSSGGDKLMRRFYEGAGLSPAFIDHVFDTPPTTIWFPTVQELLDERILTASPREEKPSTQDDRTDTP